MEIIDYGEYFDPELQELNIQSSKNDILYDEVHKSMEKCLDKLEAKTMYGAGGMPHKDVASLGTVLNDIRSNQVQIIKEKSGIKKTIAELTLKRNSQKTDEKNASTSESLMREVLMEINRKNPQMTKATQSELSNKNGIDKLNDLDPKQLGINENDLKMINKFSKNKR